MSRNFVSVSSGESKYVKASRVGAQIERSASINRQQAILEAGIAACAAAKTPAQVALEAKKAARQMGFAMQASVAEESGRNLKEIKKHIEDKAKEENDNGQMVAAGARDLIKQITEKMNGTKHVDSDETVCATDNDAATDSYYDPQTGEIINQQ